MNTIDNRHLFIKSSNPRETNTCLICGRRKNYKIHNPLSPEEVKRVLSHIKSHYPSHTTENMALAQAASFILAK